MKDNDVGEKMLLEVEEKERVCPEDEEYKKESEVFKVVQSKGTLVFKE